jgi:hypothetical protein
MAATDIAPKAMLLAGGMLKGILPSYSQTAFSFQLTLNDRATIRSGHNVSAHWRY